MRVLITGASGFVGRHLARRLVEAGDDVIAVVRPGLCRDLADLGCRLIEQDLLTDWRGPAPMHLDAVVHLAQSRRYREFPEGASSVSGTNIQGAVLAAELAQRSGAGQLVYASSGSIYAPGFGPISESTPVTPRDFYSYSKQCGEIVLEAFRTFFDVKVVRPFFIYGPGQRLPMIFPRLLTNVRAGSPITLEAAPGDDSGAGLKFTPHFVEDHVECLVRLLKKPGHALLNLAGGQHSTIREVATIMGRLVGRSPEFKPGTGQRAGDFVCDTTHLKNTLGELPSTTLEQGLARVVAEAQER